MVNASVKAVVRSMPRGDGAEVTQEVLALVRDQSSDEADQASTLIEALCHVAAGYGKTQEETVAWAEFAISTYPNWGEPLEGRY